MSECEQTGAELAKACVDTRAGFSAYLDGLLDGRSMAAMAEHLGSCPSCDAEFEAWRSVQLALGELGPAQPPLALQAQLRDALAGEMSTGRHLSPSRRLLAFVRQTLAPAGLRFGAGLAAALILLGTSVWFVGSEAPVQANDDRMANLNAPEYLYSQTPAVPVTASSGFVAVMVDAKVDARGRVYDFQILDGPKDAGTRLRVASNLLNSVFKPATVFGAPVPGHVMMTYTAVSVRG